MFGFYLTGSAEVCSWRMNVDGRLVGNCFTCVSVEEEREAEGGVPSSPSVGCRPAGDAHPAQDCKPTPPHPQCDSVLGAEMALSKSVEKSPLG